MINFKAGRLKVEQEYHSMTGFLSGHRGLLLAPGQNHGSDFPLSFKKPARGQYRITFMILSEATSNTN